VDEQKEQEAVAAADIAEVEPVEVAVVRQEEQEAAAAVSGTDDVAGPKALMDGFDCGDSTFDSKEESTRKRQRLFYS
jgi:hypothetical protein